MQNNNLVRNNKITEIISGVAYVNELNRWYVAPPKNKNTLLNSNQTKSHYLYKLLRSYISGFLFNTKIAKHVYNNKISEFENTETYFYYPFWLIGWLSLEFGGAYTYNSKPLILKMQDDNNSYIEEDRKGKAQKVFSFVSELNCFEDKMKLSSNDTLYIQCSLDAYNLHYIKNVILKHDSSISWNNAYKQLSTKLKENRKYPYFSIIYFHYFEILTRTKSIIKRIIRYKSKYRT